MITGGRVVQEDGIAIVYKVAAALGDKLLLVNIDSFTQVNVNEVFDTALNECSAVGAHEHTLLFQGFKIASNRLAGYTELLGECSNRGAFFGDDDFFDLLFTFCGEHRFHLDVDLSAC